MVRSLAPLVLLTGCLNAPREQPWFAQVFYMEAIDARYDDDGLLHVLYAENGSWHLGTIDHDAKDRAVEAGPAITMDGVALPIGFAGDRYHFSIAPRPGSDEVWLFASGYAGPVSAEGVFDPQLDLRGTTGDIEGTLVFFDEDRLLVSAEVTAESGFATAMEYPVDGSTVDVASGQPFTVVYNEGEEPLPLFALCHADVGDGYLFFEGCGFGTGVAEATSGQPFVRAETYDAMQVRDLRGGIALAAVNDDGGLATLTSTPGEYCVLPWSGDDHATLFSENRRFETEGICQGADAVIPALLEADVHPSSRSWVGLYPAAGIVLMDERKPEDAESDVTGTWCSTVSVDGVTGSFTLNEDGTLVIPSGGSEILHPEFTWERQGEKIVFHYAASDMAEAETFTHWAVRVGDTLHVKSGTTRDENEHRIDAGYRGLTGLWNFCG